MRAAQSTDRSLGRQAHLVPVPGPGGRVISLAMPGRSLGILALAAGVACSPRSGPTGDGSGSGSGGAPAPTFTVFALAEVRGQIEPCGCTTDPLGDLSRTARLIGDTRAKGP